MLQRHIFDGLQDYMIEMFVRTPQHFKAKSAEGARGQAVTLEGRDTGSRGAKQTLRERIAAEIRRAGPIPFSRYMELCLYEPELGYYSRRGRSSAKAGDFYTSSDVHAVFGRLLARQFEEMWRALDSPTRIDVIELGPGRGLFARDVLDWSAKQFPEFARGLALFVGRAVRASANAAAGAADRAHRERGSARSSILWKKPQAARARTSSSSATSSSTLFQSKSSIIAARCGLELKVSDSSRDSFRLQPAEEEFLDRYGIHPEEGERVEAPLLSLRWMDRIAECSGERRGFVILIDYGYTREEQLAGRHRDTIMTYRQHVATRFSVRGTRRAGHHRACELHGVASARHRVAAWTILHC